MLSPSLQSMTENFEAEVCGAGTTWPWQQWNHHPSIINNGLFSNPSSPACCSSGFNNMGDHFGLINNPEFLLGNNKAWSSGDESTTGNSPSDSSLVVQDMQHQHQHQMINSSIDSSSEILGIGLSSNSMTTDDWNRALLHGGGSSEALNYTSMLQQEGHGQRGCSQQIQKNFENPTINSFESVNHDNNDFSSEKKPLINTSPSNNFPIISTTTGGGPYGYSSSDLLQINNLFENESSDQTKQVPLYDTSKLMNGFQATTLLNEFSRNSLTELSSSSSSSLEKQKPTNLLQLSDHNKTAADFCNNNGSAAAIALNDFPVSLSPPSGSQFFHTKPNHGKRPTSVPSFKAMIQNDEIEGLGTVTNKKSNCVPTFKRPRIETPTPLPTFKVRKEKMGDRITALQQLVSPFGKTDTASVLHEAIEYIKFLHDQVNVLSTPYLKNGAPVQRVQNYDKSKKKETKQDLKSRGLCLVPISSTFPVAAENTTDFWIPTFGGTFR